MKPSDSDQHASVWDSAFIGEVNIENYAFSGEINIDAPPNRVWPHFFEEKKEVWSKRKYSHVAGESGKIGEVYALSHEGGQLLYEAIDVQVDKHIVLKILYRQNERDRGRLVGYDLVSLREMGSSTIVILQQVCELPVKPGMDTAEKKRQQHEFLDDILQTLKAIVEDSR